MNISVVGTGYVGLVTGTCLAEKGNNVICVDNNAAKVEAMQQGQIPIFEPGLHDLFRHNIDEGRLRFTTQLPEAIGSSAIFLALPTPPGEDGSADLSYVLGVATDLGKLLSKYAVVINKSTVPVGTARLVRDAIAENATTEFDVVSNPEFLREGQAIGDFMKPDRIIVGTSSERAAKVMRRLYAPFVKADPNRLQITDEPSAELIKYAANGFLATKISFINQIALLAEACGADIGAVRRGIGTDPRIGREFLYAGPGYGGSCFPKDTLALQHIGQTAGLEMGITAATIAANERQKQLIPEKIVSFYGGNIAGKTFALWGLAFKDKTDDIRESPALAIVDALIAADAKVVAYDPEAMPNVKRVYENNQSLRLAKSAQVALENADALIVATNWDEFSAPDFEVVKAQLQQPVLFDGRNMYDPATMQELGFYYESIGRRTVDGRSNG